MSSRCARGAVALLVGGSTVLGGGCGSADDDPVATTSEAAEAAPGDADQLSALLVTEVPSGLPRVADDDVDPPAGEKTVDDVASYAEDPDDERKVLDDYGYRHGWERFWGIPGATVTSVFVDQFDESAGASAYADDLARDGAGFYAGLLREHPADLPEGCQLLTVDDPDPDSEVTGPAAFAWCARGVFSVAVSAVRSGQTSVQPAVDEVLAVVDAQLARLPD